MTDIIEASPRRPYEEMDMETIRFCRETMEIYSKARDEKYRIEGKEYGLIEEKCNHLRGVETKLWIICSLVAILGIMFR